MRVLKGALLGLEGLLTLTSGYLLVLLGAAAVGRRRVRAEPRSAGGLQLAILVPAHDEELGIDETLASLARLDYPRERYEVVVVADNCRDRTAELARAAGTPVYERLDPTRRGKGPALAWALRRLLAEWPRLDGVVIVDADCRVSPNLLAAVEDRLVAGAAAVQANYVVANPAEAWASGLRHAAFALINTVRPIGKSTLGLSCGLLGTGMAFSRALLERVPWEAGSVTEDGEYHLRLVAAGERVVFAPEAWVSSPMPTSLAGSGAQHLRWEGGRCGLARDWTGRLVLEGVRKRDPARLHAGLEPLVPPQSLLLAANVLATLGAVSLGSNAGVRLALASLAGQVGFVLGGLALVRAPAETYRALAMAPLLVGWKLWLYGRLLAGHGPREWVRTDRGPATSRAGQGGRTWR